METDDQRMFKLNALEEARANEIFKQWKESNKQLEEEIEMFMSNKKHHIQEIMDRSDQLKCMDGHVMPVEPRQQKEANTSGNSEEIRLLKEQNELLKQLLAKEKLQ